MKGARPVVGWIMTAEPDHVVPRSPLADQVEDPAVRDNVRRHSDHLAALAENLRRLGLDEAVVDEQVMGVFRQYERELAQYIARAEDRSAGR